MTAFWIYNIEFHDIKNSDMRNYCIVNFHQKRPKTVTGLISSPSVRILVHPLVCPLAHTLVHLFPISLSIASSISFSIVSSISPFIGLSVAQLACIDWSNVHAVWQL